MANWWLISWTTYGTWLPGDKRGYCTRRGAIYVPPPKRYAKPGEPTYRASEHTIVNTLSKSASGDPVYLSAEQMNVALDAIVAENGAVLRLPKLPSPIMLSQGSDLRFLAELRRRGIPHQRGQCVVDAGADVAPQVVEIIRSLGLPLAITFNVNRLMVLPHGVSKASGLQEALWREALHMVAEGVATPGKYQPFICSSNSMPTPSGSCASRNGLKSVFVGSCFAVIRVSV